MLTFSCQHAATVQASCRNVGDCTDILGCSCTVCKVCFESSVLARLFPSVSNDVLCQQPTMLLCTVLLAAEEREQDIPGKLEQEAESEEATDAMPDKPATGMPDLAGEAVSNPSAESSGPVKQGVEEPADTVTSGIQGQVAESATSSNARQQSTSSVASTRPAPASKPTSTTGACTHTLQGTLSPFFIHLCTAVSQQPTS